MGAEVLEAPKLQKKIWPNLFKGVCAPPPPRPECIRKEGTSDAAPEAVGQAVGGGCQSGWGRLLSVTNAIEAGSPRCPGMKQQEP